MRVISRKALKDFWEKHADAGQSLKAWFHETKAAHWKSFTDLKARYRSADALPGSRVAFNIRGNTYRLIVRIHFNTGIVLVRFIGTHAQYDKIDATTIWCSHHESQSPENRARLQGGAGLRRTPDGAVLP